MLEQQKNDNQEYSETMRNAIYKFMSICQVKEQAQAEYYISNQQNNVELAIIAYYEDPNRGRIFLRKSQLEAKYKQHQQDKKNKSNLFIKFVQNRCYKIVRELRGLWKELVPDMIRGLRPGQAFIAQTLNLMRNIHFEEGDFEQCLKLCQQHSKPLFVFNYTRQIREKIATLFLIETCTFLNNNFICFGLIKNSQQYDKNIKHTIKNYDSSSICIFRINMFNELVLVSELQLQFDTQPIQINSYLKNSSKLNIDEKKIENQIIRRATHSSQDHDKLIQNELESQQNEMMQHDEEDADHQVDTILEERQLKALQEKQFLQSKLLHQQMQKQKIEKQLIEKQQIESFNQIKQERKLRKLSIPQQPQQGDIITFGFRLPKGGRILRKFHKNQHIELLFNYIEVNQEIQFEDEIKREFDLVTISPFISLRTKLNEKIGQIFPNEIQETLLVKQL